MKKTVWALIALFIPLSNAIAQECTALEDSRDGNMYRSTWIGNQRWMAENLAFNTGDLSCAYNNDSVKVITFGQLYEWKGAEHACPLGWHLPSLQEWNDMINFLGGDAIAGRKMKDTFMWMHSENGTNESGFSGLPGGYRLSTGDFEGHKWAAAYWSSSTEDGESYSAIRLTDTNDKVEVFTSQGKSALSVRCVKD